MARYLTSSTLIESAVRRASIPSAQVTFKEGDFLAFANEEMDTAVMPYVMAFHEDYFLYAEDVPLVNNVSKYEIPYRAVGNKLRDVNYVDGAGGIYELTRLTVEDLGHRKHTTLSAFYVDGSQVSVFPEEGLVASGSLRMYYYIRPNALVSEDRAMIIKDIDRNTGNITVSELPTIFSIGSLVDLIKAKSPHKCVKIDIPLVNVDTLNKVINIAPASIPASLTIGDHICLAEECIIPQIPTDIHSLLAQRIACRCLEAMNDQAGLQAANLKLSEMEQKLGAAIANRVEGAPLKVNNYHSVLKYSRYLRR